MEDEHAAAALLSIGLDPELARVYRLSDAPEASQLAALLSTVLGRPVRAGILGLQATLVVPLAGMSADVDDAVVAAREWNARFPACPLAVPALVPPHPHEAFGATVAWSPDDVDGVLRYGARRVSQEIAATLEALREAAGP